MSDKARRVRYRRGVLHGRVAFVAVEGEPVPGAPLGAALGPLRDSREDAEGDALRWGVEMFAVLEVKLAAPRPDLSGGLMVPGDFVSELVELDVSSIGAELERPRLGMALEEARESESRAWARVKDALLLVASAREESAAALEAWRKARAERDRREEGLEELRAQAGPRR